MKPIYLASDSKARKKLLETSGLKFKVISSGAVEKTRPGKSSPVALVKANAREKAFAAAQKISRGLIIAADTVISDGRSVFGKPRDLIHARRMLKKLSSKPQWIYTGVCLLDKETGKSLVSVEKTKIFMDPLTDAQISEYFRQANPLDKAGSFDIQGKGAFFIRRVEGCYYNVVGLPLRALYRMLKAFDVRIFSWFLAACICCFAALSSGCSTEYNLATGRQEAYYYSTEQEVKIGKAMAKQVDKQYKPVDDPLVQARVEEIGRKIVEVCDRKDIRYTFKAIDKKDVNAVSLPGGYVYVFKGLIDKVSDDDELAAVLAHEVAHIVARHSIKKMQAVNGYSLARIAAIVVTQSPEIMAASDSVFTDLLLGYGREDELLADELGARYAKLAGFDPRGMISFLGKLEQHNRRQPLRPKSYLKTHPYVPDRVRVVKQELGEPLEFTDYINIEQRKHGF